MQPGTSYAIDRRMVVEDQDSKDIIKLMQKNHKAFSGYYDNLSPGMWQGNAKDTAKYLFDFCKKNIAYDVESKKNQTVRTPGVILHKGVGDCKHYASMICGIADALRRQGYQIACAYTFVSDDPTMDVHHVFASVQDLKGNTYWVDPVLSTFNKRPVFFNTKILPMPLYEEIGNSAIGGLHDMELMRCDDRYAYFKVPTGQAHNIAGINEARNYKNWYNNFYTGRNTWTVDKYNAVIADLTNKRKDESKLQGKHDEAWGIQMFTDDVLNKELSVLAAKGGGPKRYPGFVQIDVGPGGTIYSWPVASNTPNVPQPQISNTTVVWSMLPFLPPLGTWFAWVNKYPPKTGAAKVLDKAWQDVKDLTLKVTIAPARNAFLALLALNVQSLATRLASNWKDNRADILRQWDDIGGAGSKFIDAMNNGLKRSSNPNARVSGSYIGVAGIDDAALLSLAAAIIGLFAKFMSKDPAGDQNIKDLAGKGAMLLSKMPGVDATTTINPDGTANVTVHGFDANAFNAGMAVNPNSPGYTPTQNPNLQDSPTNNDSLPVTLADDAARGVTQTTSNFFDDIKGWAMSTWNNHKKAITWVIVGIAAYKLAPTVLGGKRKKRR